AYTPGVNDNFTLQWTDDFNSFDAARWQKATHTWDGNNAQFVQENAVLTGGYLILCLTSNTTSGYSGGTIADTDVDPPYATSAFLFADSTILVKFSEPVDGTWAEDPAHYAGGNLTMKSAALLPDTRTVRLTVGGAMPPSPFPLIILQAKDRAANVKSVQSATVQMPLTFPLRIDVGGTGLDGYLADAAWTPSKTYGGVGGTAATVPPSTPVNGSSEPDVYRSALHGLSDYKIRVPNGIYKLTLMMMEDRYAAPGSRRFSAKAEGKTLFADLDLFQQVGANTAYAFVAPAVEVQDNVLDLWFGASVDSTTLCGIQLERISGPTGVRENPAARPGEFFLSVYPNPFNAAARLRFSLPEAESLTFSMNDLLGREVEHRDLGLTPAGSHELSLDGSQLASGVYFCRLYSSHSSSNGKIILMK
ncbi:MAG TPA: malectin domain-containing carbohydrate-binding protein, partial [Bacteroidota bacterium]